MSLGSSAGMAGAGFLVGTAKPTGVAESDISGCNWRWKERRARTSEEDEVEVEVELPEF